jgi:regulator of protease activity HflC (stomatin/prohibitin superfamily)
MLTPFWFSLPLLSLYLLNSIKILREYERGVIFRLGRALPAPKGPGIILVFRPFDQIVRISLRQDVLEVPPQDVITRDNVTLKVNAVVTLYVVDPNAAAIKVCQLRLPDLAVCADHAALRPRRSRARRCSAIATSSTSASRPSSTSAPSPSASRSSPSK